MRPQVPRCLEGVTGCLPDQLPVDADKIPFVTGVESIHRLHHIGVGEISERPLHVVIEEASPAEWEVESTVPRLTVVGSEVVPVAVNLTRSNLADLL